jgi:pectin methylesterase-like acyl-CoA thioesterase
MAVEDWAPFCYQQSANPSPGVLSGLALVKARNRTKSDRRKQNTSQLLALIDKKGDTKTKRLLTICAVAALVPAVSGAAQAIDRLVLDDYNTIQAAIDEVSDGETVIVSPGTYTENVTVNVANLTVKAAKPKKSVVDGSFDITADGVTLERFEIEMTIT